MIILETTLISFVLTGLFGFIGELLYEIEFKNKYIKILMMLLAYVLTCEKCASFWFSLLFTLNPLYAAVTSINVMVLKYVEDKYFPTLLN